MDSIDVDSVETDDAGFVDAGILTVKSTTTTTDDEFPDLTECPDGSVSYIAPGLLSSETAVVTTNGSVGAAILAEVETELQAGILEALNLGGGLDSRPTAGTAALAQHPAAQAIDRPEASPQSDGEPARQALALGLRSLFRRVPSAQLEAALGKAELRPTGDGQVTASPVMPVRPASTVQGQNSGPRDDNEEHQSAGHQALDLEVAAMQHLFQHGLELEGRGTGMDGLTSMAEGTDQSTQCHGQQVYRDQSLPQAQTLAQSQAGGPLDGPGTGSTDDDEVRAQAALAQAEADLDSHMAATTAGRVGMRNSDHSPAGRLPNPVDLSSALLQAEASGADRRALPNGFGLRHGVSQALADVIRQCSQGQG